MDFERLRAFLLVADHASLTKAATDLGLDKSSLSRQITQLECYFDARLFERTGRCLALTHAGRELHARARDIVEEIDSLKQSLPRYDGLVRGSLGVATTHALLSTWMSGFLHLFVEEYPELQLDIYASNAPIDSALSQRDIAVRPKASTELDLIQNYLCSWKLQVFASPKYLARFGTPESINDLSQHRIIIFADSGRLYPETYTHWPLYRGCEVGSYRKPYMVVNSVEAAANLVRNGVGMGAFAVDSPMFSSGEVCSVLPDTLNTEVAAYTIYRRSSSKSPVVIAFEAFLRNQVNLKKGLQTVCT